MSHHLEKQNRKRWLLSQTFCVTDDEKVYGVWGRFLSSGIVLQNNGQIAFNSKSYGKAKQLL